MTTGLIVRNDASTVPLLQSYTHVCMKPSVRDWIDMTRADRLNIRCLGWADMLTTGIDERQLRGAIDRGLIPLGEKARNGRLLFSITERFAVQIISDLTQLWVPVKKASYVARFVSARCETLMNYHAKLGAQKQDSGDLTLQITSPGGGLSIRYLVGNEIYLPGRGVTGEIVKHETAVIVCLSGMLADMWNWSNALSHSSIEIEG